MVRFSNTNNAQDYYPFGMLMPGRSYSSTVYKYGFNKGSEKDDEIAGLGNHFTTFFREGDTRLATWWGVDPEASIQPWQSPYSYMDGNPIWHNDPRGDVVDASNNKKSIADVSSIVEPKNRQMLTFSQNQDNENLNVRINPIPFSNEHMDKQLVSDKGLGLIKEMQDVPERILYDATPMTYERDALDNNGPSFLALTQHLVINASEYGKDGLDKYTNKPPVGYQGMVAIHPKANFSCVKDDRSLGEMNLKVSRSAVVFHELSENFERTHNGIDYRGNNGAHQKAINREHGFYNESPVPGCGDINMGPKELYNLYSNDRSDYKKNLKR